MKGKKHVIYSFTRLSMFEQCPRQFYHRYILQNALLESKPLLIGKAIHKAIEVFISQPSLTLEQAIYEGLKEVQFTKDVTYEELEQLFMKSWERIIHYREKKTYEPSSVIVEHHFQVNIGISKDIQFQGYIDILDDMQDGRVAVVDWKSGWKFFQLTDSKQLLLYAWVVKQITEGMFNDVVGEYVFLRFNKGHHFGKVISNDAMEDARLWAVDIALTIEENMATLEDAMQKEGVSVPTDKMLLDETFPPTYNAYCKYCPLVTTCHFGK